MQRTPFRSRVFSAAFTTVFILLSYSLSFSQDVITVKGRVVTEPNQPLQGVTITGADNIATITDNQGRFTIRAARGSVLVFSYVNYSEKTWQVNSETVEIYLESKAGNLEDVVVIGYGTQAKRTVASATSKVRAEEFQTAVINTVDQALQGRATGVQVVETSGEPGAAAVVRIRGNNSLSGSNEPLYVIDGFPMPPYSEASVSQYGAYQQNGLYGINPNDIDNMEVLKDAAATAIYGSRGANGVILITTKSGKRGDGKMELVNRTSTGRIAKPVSMMNSRQYAEIMNEAYQLRGLTPPFDNIGGIQTNTDWLDAITRNSFRQDISLNLSGGSAKTSYYISGNYLKEEGVLIGSGNQRGMIRANLNSDVNNWYTVKTQLSLVRQQANRAISTSRGWPNESGSFFDALRAAPTLEKDYLGTNTIGVPGFSGAWFANPYNELMSKTDLQKSDFNVVNIENIFKISDALRFHVTLGANQNLSRRQFFKPSSTAGGRNQDGVGNNNMSNTYSYNVNAFLQYTRQLGEDHRLSATGGVEYNKQILESVQTQSSGFGIPQFGINNIGSAQVQSIGSFREDRVIQSAFGRVNYSWKDRYMINASLRMDGASPFADNRKYAVFPAVAVGWNLSEEAFMSDVRWLTNSKLRFSYGETGSQAIAPYSSLSAYGNDFYQTGAGSTINTVLFPIRLSNANLGWERTKQVNAGIDFSILNNRLTINVDYYSKTTNDLLQPRTLPTQSGYNVIIDNYGAIRNRGFELGLQASIVENKNFRYNTRLNISRNITTLIHLGDKTTPDYVNIDGNLLAGTSGILEPGKEIGRFYGYKVIGLIQPDDMPGGTPDYPYPGALSQQVVGGWKYEDMNKDNVVNNQDRQVIGKSTPDFIFGWNNDLTWKRWGLSLFFTGSVGNDILNVTQFYLNNGLPVFVDIGFNQTSDWYKNRWTTSNQHDDIRYPGTQNTSPAVSDAVSTMVEDGSFARLKMATLSYSLPDIKFVKNPRLFVTGTNLLTITKYTGFDPEVSAYGQDLLRQGIDFGSYPTQRNFTIGISCNF